MVSYLQRCGPLRTGTGLRESRRHWATRWCSGNGRRIAEVRVFCRQVGFPGPTPVGGAPDERGNFRIGTRRMPRPPPEPPTEGRAARLAQRWSMADRPGAVGELRHRGRCGQVVGAYWQPRGSSGEARGGLGQQQGLSPEVGDSPRVWEMPVIACQLRLGDGANVGSTPGLTATP